ncbi:hypothetical protein LTR10_008860 [Elasticomyces elasticus]|nr:hypothetical protein LTR10_008860 [Elasticomyces elasticus]KAK4974169.1 hypothetical protein LTR42_004808 [Elasticomyces elasticus]
MDSPSLEMTAYQSYSSTSQDGDQLTTPATSPSIDSISSWSDIVKERKLSPEAAQFFGDLKNCLALGCLVFEDLTTLHEGIQPDVGWQEITHLPIILISDSTLSAQLAKLAQAGWLRVQSGRSALNPRFHILRMYILPSDAGLHFLDRRDSGLWKALQALVSEVDVTPEAWQGRVREGTGRKFDQWATCDEGSLFYMFNKLPSPSPSIDAVTEKYTHEALEDLLDPASVLPGLKTVLYPYQRRSAGLMLQREAVPRLLLDPRLEQRQAPDGSTYYYNARDLLFLRQPRYQETCRGGILAETMGLGKTVILLSLILACKNHQPVMPSASRAPPIRAKVGKLSDMAISTINRHSVPWKVEFERIRHATGDEMTSCIAKLEQSPPMYEIPQEPRRWNRKTILPAPKSMTLAATTLIVVPRNLCKQWQSEIKKHVEDGALKVLVMEDLKCALPPPDELRTYDVVLFSRNRFEAEIRDGSDEQGRRMLATQLTCHCPYIGSTRERDCRCIRQDSLYDSPLKHLHFKRAIIDEGHFFGTNNSTAVTVANKLVKADHRWVVSGTPAKDLLGVEVDMSLTDSMWQTPQMRDSRETILDQRRAFSAKEDVAGAAKSLGVLATSFLKIRPWCAEGDHERKEADWDDYIYRHEDLRKRTYSGFSTCLRRTLEAMVVKTRPEDVERDIELPPLSHEVVRLEPSFYDKLSANLFTLVLTANAVTSERTDADYLFHKNSAKARYQLVSNLRQSAFFWTGFSENDVLASVENSRRYLAKQDTSCTPEDRQLLGDMLAQADNILASDGWKAMSRSHELGLFIDAWPEESAQHWTFDGVTAPLLTGVSQLLDAQKHVNERVGSKDLGEGLSGAGIRALAPARQAAIKEEPEETAGKKKKADKSPLTKSGLPTSSLEGEPVLKRRSSIGSKAIRSSSKKISHAFKVAKPQKRTAVRRTASLSAKLEAVVLDGFPSSANTQAPSAPAQPARSSRKRRRSEIESLEYPCDSPYLHSRVVGTTSAKLSYLVTQIVRYHKDEKILVFYDGDNIAYYLAQMLELLHIKHDIYAKSLSAVLKAEYVVRFDQEPQSRVLLMDVRQAAFGLNLSSASRIFFVNPVCRPNIEAQALKRAHRIGQTRKVYVETLVLKGTIEEKMLERAKRMTRSEHADAKALEDDGGIREIIQSARMLPVSQEERQGCGQMARLEEKQQLWGRDGWRETVSIARSSEKKRRRVITFDDITKDDEDARLVNEGEELPPGAKRRVLSFVDCTGPSHNSLEADEDSDEPVMNDWRRGSSSGIQPSLPAGLRNDLMLPVVGHAEQLAPAWPQLSARATVFDPTTRAGKVRGMSIQDLLNDHGDNERAFVQFEDRRTFLLKEIVSRL